MRSATRAQALVFLAAALPVFVAMTGLAIDGALLLAARRELQSAVDGAARAGATRVDMASLRDGGEVRLDAAGARAASAQYIDQWLGRDLAWQAPPRVRIEVTEIRVQVRVEGDLQPAFLRIAGIERVPVAATADADVQAGIRAPGDP